MKYIVEFPAEWYLRVYDMSGGRQGATPTGDPKRATRFDTPEAAMAALKLGTFKRDAKKAAKAVEVAQ